MRVLCPWDVIETSNTFSLLFLRCSLAGNVETLDITMMSDVRQEELSRIMNTGSPAFMEQSQPAVFALFSKPRVVIQPMAHLICRRKNMDFHWLIEFGRGVCRMSIVSTKWE